MQVSNAGKKTRKILVEINGTNTSSRLADYTSSGYNF
jgi:hypothetical protein